MSWFESLVNTDPAHYAPGEEYGLSDEFAKLKRQRLQLLTACVLLAFGFVSSLFSGPAFPLPAKLSGWWSPTPTPPALVMPWASGAVVIGGPTCAGTCLIYTGTAWEWSGTTAVEGGWK